MARQPVLNGDTGLTARSKWNDNIEELYGLVSTGVTFLGILNNGNSVTGSPSAGDYYKIAEAGTYGTVECEAFDELYYNGEAWQRLSGAGKSYQEKQTQADGTSDSPPLGPEDTEITHTLSRTYVEAPEVSLQSYCDWSLYIKSVTIDEGVVTVKIGIGSSGSANSIAYTLLALR